MLVSDVHFETYEIKKHDRKTAKMKNKRQTENRPKNWYFIHVSGQIRIPKDDMTHNQT